jgi:tRNA threonylcarbamoyladenosine biosynthesis protein TsaE
MDGVVVDEAALREWGNSFARRLKPPVVVGLSGELGAGKTTLARAIAEGLGVADAVTSPTYALVQSYDGAGVRLYHLDAYRLAPGDDVRDLGIADILSSGEAVLLIEWPERLGEALPRLDHHIRLEYADAGARRRLVGA